MREAGLDAAFAADAETVALAPGVATDLVAFAAAVAEGDADRVLDLYAGGLLRGFDLAAAPAFADWLGARRETFAQRWREVAERRCDALAEAGDLRSALREAHRLIADDSLQEAHFRRVMRLHQRLGEREAALDAFERCRKALGRELGLRPLPETVALAEAIRASHAGVTTAATLGRRHPLSRAGARAAAAGRPRADDRDHRPRAGRRRLGRRRGRRRRRQVTPARRAGRARSRRPGPCGACQRCAGAVRGARPLAAQCAPDRRCARRCRRGPRRSWRASCRSSARPATRRPPTCSACACTRRRAWPGVRGAARAVFRPSTTGSSSTPRVPSGGAGGAIRSRARSSSA